MSGTTINDYLHEEAMKAIWFDPPEKPEYRTVETWVDKESAATASSCVENTFDNDADLTHWLAHSDRTEKLARGGLRLVIHEMSSARYAFLPGNDWFPIRRDVFMNIVEDFDVPTEFLRLITLRAGYRLQLRALRSNGCQVLKVVAAYPKMVHYWWSLAISFNPERNLTSAFVTVYSHPRSVSIDSFVRVIKKTVAQSAHPLFLPCVLLTMDTRGLASFAYMSRDKLLQVQDCTGFVDLSAVYQPTQTLEIEVAYRKLVALHHEINHPGHNYIIDYVARLKEILAHFNNDPMYKVVHQHPYHQQDQYALEHLVEVHGEILTGITAGHMHVKEAIDMELKALYHLMQSRDTQLTIQLANDSRRDSRTMKIVTIITAVYLPGTFLSGIFGMNLFDFDAGGIRVSSMFWLYWSILIPLTAITLGAWATWANRTRLFRRYYRRRSSGVKPDSPTTTGPRVRNVAASAPTTMSGRKPNGSSSAVEHKNLTSRGPDPAAPDPTRTSMHAEPSPRPSVSGPASLLHRSLSVRSTHRSSLHRTSTSASRSRNPATPPPPPPGDEAFSVTVHDEPPRGP